MLQILYLNGKDIFKMIYSMSFYAISVFVLSISMLITKNPVNVRNCVLCFYKFVIEYPKRTSYDYEIKVLLQMLIEPADCTLLLRYAIRDDAQLKFKRYTLYFACDRARFRVFDTLRIPSCSCCRLLMHTIQTKTTITVQPRRIKT